MEGAVARAKLYMEAGADAIFPEALNTPEMFREFAARMPGVKLLANMTEFGRTPFFTAAEFQDMGYRMVIWPVSSLRVANKAQAELYAAIRRDGGAQAMVDRMQTRAELYAAIGYHDYEALDATIVKTVIPEGMPQRRSPCGRGRCVGACFWPRWPLFRWRRVPSRSIRLVRNRNCRRKNWSSSHATGRGMTSRSRWRSSRISRLSG
jgi:hypothetical protein